MKLQKIEPFKIDEEIIFEVYFAKFFPVERLIEKGIMRRTNYGLTLTRNFKERIIQEMIKLQVDSELVSKFREKNYLEIELEKLWFPAVSAVCGVNDCECKVEGNHIYVPVEKADIIRTEASAVHYWFRHVKNLLEKAEKDNIKIMGEYV